MVRRRTASATQTAMGGRPLVSSSRRENAVTGTSFAEASAPSPPKTESAPVALRNEVPVTAFSLAQRSTRRPTGEPPERTSGTD